jgi:hypothetical protein
MNTIELKSTKSSLGNWKFQFEEGVVQLTQVERGNTFEISREEVPERFQLTPMGFGESLLVVRDLSNNKMKFWLTFEQMIPIKSWLGPPTFKQLRAILRTRQSFALPVAVILIIVSLPIEPDPSAGIVGNPFQPITLVLGLGIASLWVVAKIRANRYLFLFDSLWMALAGINSTLTIINEDYSRYWLFL